jgi:hypothetical protein
MSGGTNSRPSSAAGRKQVRIITIRANLKRLRFSGLALCLISLRRASALHSPEIQIEQGFPFVALVLVLLAQAQNLPKHFHVEAVSLGL